MTDQDDGWQVQHATTSKDQLEDILAELETVAAAPSTKVSHEARQALRHAGEIIDSDRFPLFEVIGKLADPVNVGDAAIYAARLLEAAFTIGVFAGQTEGARELARRLEDISHPQRRTRQLGIRLRIIEVLRQRYPAGDPVTVGGMLSEEVRKVVESDLGVAVSTRTLERAREDAFRK